MNDRFKFRVWSNKYNDYLSPEIITTIMGLCKSNDLTTVRIGTLPSFDNNLTIEQCTGLKDKNGNLIYEGDIIEIQCFTVERGGFTKTAKVVYSIYDMACEAGSCFALETMDDEIKKLLCMWHSKECEIIGNIHEHKE